MELTTRAVLVGMKRFKGEAGSEFERIDFTKVFVQEKFRDDNPDARGVAAIEYEAGNSLVFEKYKGLVLPALCDLVLESVTGNGRTSKLVVRDIRPVDAGKVAKSV